MHEENDYSQEKGEACSAAKVQESGRGEEGGADVQEAGDVDEIDFFILCYIGFTKG